MIHVLYITRNLKDYVDRSFFYFAAALSKACHLQLWHEDGNIQVILRQLPNRPDFILLNDFRDNECPHISGLSDLDIPYGAIMHDLHYRVEARKKYILDNHINHLFTVYRDAFKQTYPEFMKRMHWFPHFVDTSIFYDYKLAKDIDYLLLGCTVKKYYPLRRLILDQMKHIPGFVSHEHPGYKNITEQERSTVKVGMDYAMELNRAKIFLTCDSIYHYPLRKYYEALACKSLLLAPQSKELIDLGFVPDKHFIAITEQDFLEKATYYINNKEEREQIAEAGYRFVHQKHSTTVRVAELLRLMKAIIKDEAHSSQ